jgi:putative transposase
MLVATWPAMPGAIAWSLSLRRCLRHGGCLPDYRRNRVPGGTYFFTANLLNRASDRLVTRIEVLRAAVQTTRAHAPFHIDAWVVLPVHMHCIWTLPPDDEDYPAAGGR